MSIELRACCFCCDADEAAGFRAVDAFNGKDLTEKKGMVVVGEEEGSWKF